LTRAEIDPIYQAIGRITEERFFINKPEYQREVPFKTPVNGEVTISGRADGVADDHVVEIKSTISQVKRREVIKQGILPPEYLGQLMTYLYAFHKSWGIIHVAYLHFDKAGNNLEFETRDFKVELVENVIYVDGERKVENARWYVMNFYTTLAGLIISDTLAPMPITNNPCKSCVLQATCEKNLKSKAEFVEELNTLTGSMDVGQSYTPSIKNHDVR
jgi:CRISPR/Cas system-associated exonuclease Cas4 (RecB family)